MKLIIVNSSNLVLHEIRARNYDEAIKTLKDKNDPLCINDDVHLELMYFKKNEITLKLVSINYNKAWKAIKYMERVSKIGEEILSLLRSK